METLKALHAEGYAHCNVKPANIMRRRKEHDWILSDFDRAAALGALHGNLCTCQSTAAPARMQGRVVSRESALRATLCNPPPHHADCSVIHAGEAVPAVEHMSRLRYSAPEVLQRPGAAEPGTVRVSCAQDVWAVGVIAFELLTGERAFPETALQEEIQSALLQGELPWEAGVPGAEERQAKFRGLRRAVLACLDRHPANRPTAASLLSSWESVFDSMKTRGTFETSPSGVGEAGRPAQ
jgi:serine/threonine protein kinase